MITFHVNLVIIVNCEIFKEFVQNDHTIYDHALITSIKII